jgi:sulfatase modifying factor 1
LERPLFPWGDEEADITRANYAASGLMTTTPVGKYAANGWGLYDMAGNAWEFMADHWQPYKGGSSKKPSRRWTVL